MLLTKEVANAPLLQLKISVVNAPSDTSSKTSGKGSSHDYP